MLLRIPHPSHHIITVTLLGIQTDKHLQFMLRYPVKETYFYKTIVLFIYIYIFIYQYRSLLLWKIHGTN